MTNSTDRYGTEGERNNLQTESVAIKTELVLNPDWTTVEENNKFFPAQSTEEATTVGDKRFTPTNSELEASQGNEKRGVNIGRKRAKREQHQDKLNELEVRNGQLMIDASAKPLLLLEEKSTLQASQSRNA